METRHGQSSPEGKAEIMRAYPAIMDVWHRPYEEIRVPTSFGETHVIAADQKARRPFVLLHALGATATSWYCSSGALSKSHRVYAVDVIGEGNKKQEDLAKSSSNGMRAHKLQ